MNKIALIILPLLYTLFFSRRRIQLENYSALWWLSDIKKMKEKTEIASNYSNCTDCRLVRQLKRESRRHKALSLSLSLSFSFSRDCCLAVDDSFLERPRPNISRRPLTSNNCTTPAVPFYPPRSRFRNTCRYPET